MFNQKIASLVSALTLALVPATVVPLVAMTLNPSVAEAQAGVTYSTVSVRNNTNEVIQVEIRFRDYYQGWITQYFNIEPYSQEYIADTTNRYIYLRAYSLYSNNLSWGKREVNIGSRQTKFTYTYNY